MNFQGSRSYMKNSFKNMNKSFFNNKYSFKMCNTKINSNFFYSLVNNRFHMININLLKNSSSLISNLKVSKSSLFLTNESTNLTTDHKELLQILQNGISL